MRRQLAGAVVLAALGLLLVAAPVAAFPLTQCELSVNSVGADGGPIDLVAGGGADATQDDPFSVDWDGTVTYDGTAQIEMRANAWQIDIFGFPTPLQGGDANAADSRIGKGSIAVSASVPFRFTGLYFVSGTITGSGGTCVGSGWFKMLGDPFGTIPFWIALGLAILGVLMLGRGARGHSLTSVVGGVVGGLGITIWLVLFSALPLGVLTPLAVLLIGVILGMVLALIGQRTRDRQPAPLA